MNRYWPTTHPITFGVFQVEMLEEDKKEFLETRVFNITNTMVSIYAAIYNSIVIRIIIYVYIYCRTVVLK